MRSIAALNFTSCPNPLSVMRIETHHKVTEQNPQQSLGLEIRTQGHSKDTDIGIQLPPVTGL